jgi:uncharacterized protein (TIGR02246 family)
MSTSSEPQEVPGRIVSAWARQDADEFAGVFTEDGTMILPGNVYLKGRGSIREYMKAAFEGSYKDTRVTGQPVDVRALSGDVAVLVTQGGVMAPGETALADKSAIWATWVITKQEGGWLLAAYQNTPKQ